MNADRDIVARTTVTSAANTTVQATGTRAGRAATLTKQTGHVMHQIHPSPDTLRSTILNGWLEGEIFKNGADSGLMEVGHLLAIGCPVRALERAEALLAERDDDRAVLVGAVQIAVQTICHELQNFDADKDDRFAGRGIDWFVAKRIEIESAYRLLPHDEAPAASNVDVTSTSTHTAAVNHAL